jgi:hypothetical protein
VARCHVPEHFAVRIRSVSVDMTLLNKRNWIQRRGYKLSRLSEFSTAVWPTWREKKA